MLARLSTRQRVAGRIARTRLKSLEKPLLAVKFSAIAADTVCKAVRFGDLGARQETVAFTGVAALELSAGYEND